MSRVLLDTNAYSADWFAHIKQGLRKRGTPIPMNDVWIAASCMEHGAELASLDAHFEAVAGLKRTLF